MNPRARAEARSWDAVEGLRLRPPHTSSAGKSPQKKRIQDSSGGIRAGSRRCSYSVFLKELSQDHFGNLQMACEVTVTSYKEWIEAGSSSFNLYTNNRAVYAIVFCGEQMIHSSTQKMVKKYKERESPCREEVVINGCIKQTTGTSPSTLCSSYLYLSSPSAFYLIAT